MEFLALFMPVLAAIFINGYLGKKTRIVGYLILVLFFSILVVAVGTFFQIDIVVSIGYIVSVLSILTIIVLTLTLLKHSEQKVPDKTKLPPFQVPKASVTSDSGENSNKPSTMTAEELASCSKELKRLLKNSGIHNGLQFQVLAKKKGKALENLNENDAKIAAILIELSKSGVKIRTIAELNAFFKKY